MKRKHIAWLLIVLLAAALLAGCGAKSAGTEASMDQTAPEMPMPAEMTADMARAGYNGAGASASPAAPDSGADSGVKIIYTADLTLEATDFDAAAEAVKALTEDCGGYFSSSNLSNGGSYRSASHTVRVPADKYRDFLDRAGQTAHRLDLYEDAEDVSEEYYDAAGRLKTQQTKLDRLQELLAKAKSMEDIITIESAVSETEEQIDRLSGQLRWYDARVDYATVDVSLREVSRLSNVPEPAQSFGSRMLSALKDGLAGFAEGMEGLLLALAYGWEWLMLIGAGVAAAALLIRRAHRRRKAKTEPANKKSSPK